MYGVYTYLLIPLNSEKVSYFPAEGLAKLTSIFKTCKPLSSKDDAAVLKGWLNNVYGNLAMADYPYPASFLAPLPAWPIKVCSSHHIHRAFILFKITYQERSYLGSL